MQRPINHVGACVWWVVTPSMKFLGLIVRSEEFCKVTQVKKLKAYLKHAANSKPCNISKPYPCHIVVPYGPKIRTIKSQCRYHTAKLTATCLSNSPICDWLDFQAIGKRWLKLLLSFILTFLVLNISLIRPLRAFWTHLIQIRSCYWNYCSWTSWFT